MASYLQPFPPVKENKLWSITYPLRPYLAHLLCSLSWSFDPSLVHLHRIHLSSHLPLFSTLSLPRALPFAYSASRKPLVQTTKLVFTPVAYSFFLFALLCCPFSSRYSSIFLTECLWPFINSPFPALSVLLHSSLPIHPLALGKQPTFPTRVVRTTQPSQTNYDDQYSQSHHQQVNKRGVRKGGGLPQWGGEEELTLWMLWV